MLIDKLVGYFSPNAGLKRVQARAALSMARRYYDAARPTDADGWRRVGGGGPKTTVQRDLVGLVAHSRDLVRNNAFARRMSDLYTAYHIGSGIQPEWTNPSRKAAWDRWANSTYCDADDRLNFAGLCALAVETEFAAGEALIQLIVRRRPAQEGLPPIELRVLEPDHLDNTKDGDLKGGGYIKQGIEFDRRGRRVAYRIWEEHPADRARSTKSIRVPAWQIIHFFEPSRPGQIRGVPKLAAGALKIRDADELLEAGIHTAKVAALFGVILHGGTPNWTPMAQQGATEAEPDSMEPGAIMKFTGGESVTVTNPPQVNGTTETTRTTLQGAAVSVGLDYTRVSGDLRGANYSSLRASAVDIKRLVAKKQKNVIIPQICQTVARWFDSFGSIAGLWEGNEAPPWTPPKWEPVDPLKEVQADEKEVQAGFSSQQEKVRERGRNHDEVVAENGKAKAEMEAQGLSYTTFAGKQPASAPPESEEDDDEDAGSSTSE